MYRDPVCGMKVDPAASVANREHGGEVFYFCSQECVDKFDDDPHYYGHPKFTDEDKHGGHHQH